MEFCFTVPLSETLLLSGRALQAPDVHRFLFSPVQRRVAETEEQALRNSSLAEGPQALPRAG